MATQGTEEPTLFRDGNNNLGQLLTLTVQGSTLPQSTPTDATGNPFGTANPLPVAVAGVPTVQLSGQGPTPIDVSVSVTTAAPVEYPDYPLAIGGAGLGGKLDEIIVELRLLNMMFANECCIDLDDWRRNLLLSLDPNTDSQSNSTSTSSYTN